MFWKKNKKKSELTVNIESKTIRQTYRVKSTRGFPIFAFINTKKYFILDLSAGGISFSSSDFLKDDTHKIKLYLPIGKTILDLSIQVVRVSNNTINQCKFLDILEEEENIIHKFIMDYQKCIIKKKKELKKIKSLKKQKMTAKQKMKKKILREEELKQKKIKSF